MKLIAIRSLALLLSAILLPACAFAADAPPTLAQQLEPLRPFIGKTWRGKFKNSTPEKPAIDISKWERALNGRAVRITHSINDGEYGGETLFVWNPKTGKVEYYYFTTAGFMTRGVIEFQGEKMISKEEVIGNQEGVTLVEAVSELKDGKLHVKSRYFKKGEWVDGHDVTYEEAPGAEVRFK